MINNVQFFKNIQQVFLWTLTAVLVVVIAAMWNGTPTYEERTTALRKELVEVKNELAVYPIIHPKEDNDTALLLWKAELGRQPTPEELWAFTAKVIKPYTDLEKRRREIESELERLQHGESPE